MELKDTIEGMTSDNYKDRLIAEYQQLAIRYDKLSDIIRKHFDGTLEFILFCDVHLLLEQRAAMGTYKEILEERIIAIEDTELD